MKKILFVLAVTVMGQVVIAQQAPADSVYRTQGKEHRKHGKMRRGGEAPMKALNLTDEQQGQLKEMRKANKAKKDAILADTKLNEEQKRSALKSIHQEEAGKIQQVLTDEQKAKFKELKEKRKRAKRAGKQPVTGVAAGSESPAIK